MHNEDLPSLIFEPLNDDEISSIMEELDTLLPLSEYRELASSASLKLFLNDSQVTQQ